MRMNTSWYPILDLRNKNKKIYNVRMLKIYYQNVTVKLLSV